MMTMVLRNVAAGKRRTCEAGVDGWEGGLRKCVCVAAEGFRSTVGGLGLVVGWCNMGEVVCFH
jgi:hypothetical protein